MKTERKHNLLLTIFAIVTLLLVSLFVCFEATTRTRREASAAAPVKLLYTIDFSNPPDDYVKINTNSVPGIYSGFSSYAKAPSPGSNEYTPYERLVKNDIEAMGWQCNYFNLGDCNNSGFSMLDVTARYTRNQYDGEFFLKIEDSFSFTKAINGEKYFRFYIDAPNYYEYNQLDNANNPVINRASRKSLFINGQLVYENEWAVNNETSNSPYRVYSNSYSNVLYSGVIEYYPASSESCINITRPSGQYCDSGEKALTLYKIEAYGVEPQAVEPGTSATPDTSATDSAAPGSDNKLSDTIDNVANELGIGTSILSAVLILVVVILVIKVLKR